MNEGTSVLFGLEYEFAVLQLHRIDPDTVRVVIEVTNPDGVCPGCGVLTSRVKERPLACETATFTQESFAVTARSRLTTRLREKIGSATASGNRAVSEVRSRSVRWVFHEAGWKRSDT